MDNLVTKWWLGVGPLSKVSLAINGIEKDRRQIQLVNNIGQYESFEKAALIAARIECKEGEKAPTPHPGYDFEPVFEAEG